MQCQNADLTFFLKVIFWEFEIGYLSVKIQMRLPKEFGPIVRMSNINEYFKEYRYRTRAIITRS